MEKDVKKQENGFKPFLFLWCFTWHGFEGCSWQPLRNMSDQKHFIFYITTIFITYIATKKTVFVDSSLPSETYNIIVKLNLLVTVIVNCHYHYILSISL